MVEVSDFAFAESPGGAAAIEHSEVRGHRQRSLNFAALRTGSTIAKARDYSNPLVENGIG
jgi:hypothetical protein